MSHRIRISDDAYNVLAYGSSTTGRSHDDLIQLWAQAAGIDAAAATAREALTTKGASQDELKRGLADCAPNLRVAAIRLDQLHSSPTTQADGFLRTHAGADLGTDGATLWSSVRGLWVISTRSNAIAAYRLGQFLGLYCGVTWSAANTDDRRFALTGYEVTDGARIDPVTGEALQATVSAEEGAALRFLSTHSLAMPAGAANPIANLYIG